MAIERKQQWPMEISCVTAFINFPKQNQYTNHWVTKLSTCTSAEKNVICKRNKFYFELLWLIDVHTLHWSSGGSAQRRRKKDDAKRKGIHTCSKKLISICAYAVNALALPISCVVWPFLYFVSFWFRRTNWKIKQIQFSRFLLVLSHTVFMIILYLMQCKRWFVLMLLLVRRCFCFYQMNSSICWCVFFSCYSRKSCYFRFAYFYVT